jgi:hypothetical protein
MIKVHNVQPGAPDEGARMTHVQKTGLARPQPGPKPKFSVGYGAQGVPKPYKAKRYKEMLTSELGSTPEGRAWALAALHPCGEGEIVSDNLGSVYGMPDTMTGSVVTPIYRGETNIGWDSTMFETPPTDLGGTWGIDIVIPPIPEIDYLYRLTYSIGNLVSNWKVVRTANFNLPGDPLSGGTTLKSVGYGKFRLIGQGHTLELDANTQVLQGRLVAGQMQGQWTISDLNVPSTNFSANTTTDQFTPTFPQNFMAVVGSDNAMKLHKLAVPVDPNVIAQTCPSALQCNARDGAYIVSKFSSPLLGYEFRPTGDDGTFRVNNPYLENGSWLPPSGLSPITSLPGSAFAITTDNGGTNSTENLAAMQTFVPGSSFGNAPNELLPIFNSTTLTTGLPADSYVFANQIHPFVSTPSDMMTAVVTVRGLILAVSSGGLTSGSPNFRIKSRLYIEAISNANNPGTGPFIHQPAPYDMPALDSVIVAGKRMADGYPAIYNEGGGVLGSIWNALTGSSEPIKSVLDGLGLGELSSKLMGLLG